MVDSTLATVRITVAPVNDAPTIAPRTITLDEDAPVVLDMLDGAADVDGDALSVLITTQPQHGTLTQNADGTWTYAPDANWDGSEAVEYLVSDGQANTATQISFVVTPVNDAPVASEPAAPLLEDGTVSDGLLGSEIATIRLTERTVQTGATYTLSMGLAGHLDYSAEYARISIYVNGVRIGGADNTSPVTGLAWATRRKGGR